MLTNQNPRYRLHGLVFLFLSFQLFIFTPTEFFHRTIAAALCICVLLHLKNLKFNFKGRLEKALFITVSAYLSFAFFGYDLFLVDTFSPGRLRDAVFIPPPGEFNVLWTNINYDLNMPDTRQGIFLYKLLYFALGFIWTGYVFKTFLDAIKTLGLRIASLNAAHNAAENTNILCGKKYWQKWLILFAVMFGLFMVWQRAYIIALAFPDSWEYLFGWILGSYVSFRLPVYAFLINIICTLAPTQPEVQWFVFTKIFAFSALLATILMYFHKKGIRFRYIVPAAVILPLIPSIGLQPLAILPDLANGMAILWLTYVLARILDEVILRQSAGRAQKISFCIQLCISLVFVFFMRPNSFPVFLVMAPVTALLFLLRKQWKLLAAVAVSVLMVLMIRFPGYNALNVHFPSPHIPQIARYYNMQFRAGIHDIHAAYRAGGTFSEDVLSWLQHIIPRLSDPELVFIPGFAQSAQYNVQDLNTRTFLLMYLDSFVNNPVAMIRSILTRIRAYWVIDPKGPINAVNFTVIVGDYRLLSEYFQSNLSKAPLLGIERPNTFLAVMLNEYMVFMNKTIPAMFIWRFGVWSALMIISVMILILQKKYLWLLVYLPVFVYFITLVLTAGWPDHRYGLPVFFVGMFLPPILMLINPYKEADANE